MNAVALRRLYVTRAAFTVAWVAALLAVAGASGAGAPLAVVLAVYPAFDAAAVWWQARSAPSSTTGSARSSEGASIAVSVVAAVALAVAGAQSERGALAVWGVWAIAAGVPQLITALRRRAGGGQVPQMLSGGLSVLAGGAFVAQAAGGADAVAGVGGYALVGAVFFAVSAARLRGQRSPAVG